MNDDARCRWCGKTRAEHAASRAPCAPVPRMPCLGLRAHFLPEPVPTMPNPAALPILQYFAYAHLPPHLQAVSKPIGELAQKMVEELPPGPELSAGLRKLLEAKDCFVRAALR